MYIVNTIMYKYMCTYVCVCVCIHVYAWVQCISSTIITSKYACARANVTLTTPIYVSCPRSSKGKKNTHSAHVSSDIVPFNHNLCDLQKMHNDKNDLSLSIKFPEWLMCDCMNGENPMLRNVYNLHCGWGADETKISIAWKFMFFTFFKKHTWPTAYVLLCCRSTCQWPDFIKPVSTTYL